MTHPNHNHTNPTSDNDRYNNRGNGAMAARIRRREHCDSYMGANMGAQNRTKVPIRVPKIELRYLFGYLNRGAF
jgi:hypothetical protein